MSDERYEIKGKLGQGGAGAVYQAFDTQLNREVAIKRVLADGGYENQEEATKNLLKEATALSSVQHPPPRFSLASHRMIWKRKWGCSAASCSYPKFAMSWRR